MRAEHDFEFFVCYYERGAEDFAERIYDVLTKDRNYTVYVDHVLRNYRSGRSAWERDEIIKKCRVFILLNTYSALERNQVIREVRIAFPNGTVSGHEFWIFRHKAVYTPHSKQEFKEKTGIDLNEYTQQDFSTTSELTRIILAKCD